MIHKIQIVKTEMYHKKLNPPRRRAGRRLMTGASGKVTRNDSPDAAG
jgi:hypothetical protein